MCIRDRDLPARSLRTLGKTHGERVGTMIASVVRQSLGQNRVEMEPQIWEELMALRDFMFERVYARDWAANESQKAEHILSLIHI